MFWRNKHRIHHFGQQNSYKHWVDDWFGTFPMMTVLTWIPITPVHIFRRYQVVHYYLRGCYPILVNRMHTSQTHASKGLDARSNNRYVNNGYWLPRCSNNFERHVTCRKKPEHIYLPPPLQTLYVNSHNVLFRSTNSNESFKHSACVNRSISNLHNENHRQQVSTSIVKIVHKETESVLKPNNIHVDHRPDEDQSSDDETQKYGHGRRECSFVSNERYVEDEEGVELNPTAYTANDINNVHSSTETAEILKLDKESSETKCIDNRTHSGLNYDSTLSIQQKEENVVTKLMTELMGTSLSSTVSTQHLQSFKNTDDFVRLNTSNCYSRLTIEVDDKHYLRKKEKSITNVTWHEVLIPTTSTELVCEDHTRKKKKSTTDITCEVVPIHEQKTDRKQFVYHGATDHVLQPRELYWCVMPVTREVFVQELRRIVEITVQGEPVPAQESMRFELLRSCTYRTFPKDGKPDVRKLAEAGFYYASNNDEVICYCCYKRIRNWKADDDPLAVHRRISPTCRFFTDAATVNLTKEVTAHVEAEIMAKIQGGRQRNTPQSAPLQTRKESQMPGNVADAGVSLRHRPPAQAHGQSALAQSGDTSLPMHQPPNRTRELAKYQSMMPQTTLTETNSRRPQFQTGVLVPQGNFSIPLFDTKAVQPSEDEHEQGANIYEFSRESRNGDVHTPVTSAAATAESSHAPVQQSQTVESLMLSDASGIVQSMGYDEQIVRQALSNLLENGVTQPVADVILNEIFQIEDRT